MTREEKQKAIRILQWLHNNNFLFASTEEDVKYATKLAMQALEQEPCEDCISREHLLEEIASLKESPWFKDDTNCAMAIRKEAIEIVEDLCIRKEPSVNPQKPKIGHWVRWYEQKEHEWYTENIPHCKCSECGKEYDAHSSLFINYCNECGARMEG